MTQICGSWCANRYDQHPYVPQMARGYRRGRGRNLSIHCGILREGPFAYGRRSHVALAQGQSASLPVSGLPQRAAGVCGAAGAVSCWRDRWYRAGVGFIRCGCRDHAHGTIWTRHSRLM